jgi:hypothetical protein
MVETVEMEQYPLFQVHLFITLAVVVVGLKPLLLELVLAA